MDQNELKRQVAFAALQYVEEDSVIGVGTGSTVDFFIDALAEKKIQLRGAVASSERTAKKLQQLGVELIDLNQVLDLSVYIDGADEITEHFSMIKGGGGALTREKIVAAVAKKFVCIADASKKVDVLGNFALPVEVIPMARSYVARQLVKLGGEPRMRIGFTTDNGNTILDVHGLSIVDPVALETAIDGITGVVCNGLFAKRGADVLLLATPQGVQTYQR